MVVGGSNSEGLLDDVELISPTPNDECSNAVARISGTGQNLGKGKQEKQHLRGSSTAFLELEQIVLESEQIVLEF
jgi:hypothetical protein